ncbi:MAG TPA: plastocyanin/azurin family copper-binding protein [Chthoniobacterales bacterium]|nr:plastocyanin/azurin family copper-binding protein [Chthoniobacterales bacterium]
MKSQLDVSKNRAALRKMGEAKHRRGAFTALTKPKTMKKTVIQYSLCFIALICGALAACSQAPSAPPKEVKIQADDKMKFDVTAFEAKPGQKVKITLTNVGVTPKYSMGHNCIVLDRNVNVQAFLDAASMAAATDYVPKDFKGVLGHTKLLGPGESDSFEFNAPYIPGDYPFFCSFPGHYSQGTKGMMTVKQ